MAMKLDRSYFLPKCLIILCHGISIKSFVWAFFIFAMISFLITYIHVMLVLEMNNPDSIGSNYDYLDVPVINFDHAAAPPDMKGNRLILGDQAREGRNIIATKILDSSNIADIQGWWMPNVRWTAEIDCKTGLSHICRKVLSVNCEPNKLHSIYQFLPISPLVQVTSLQFSAISSSPDMTLDEDYESDKISSYYSAIAYIKYSDATFDHIRLDFSAGSHSEESLMEEKYIPTTKSLESVTVILACKGYKGVAKFHATSLVPAGPRGTWNDAFNTVQCNSLQHTETNLTTRGFTIEKLVPVYPASQSSFLDTSVSLVTQVSMDHLEELHDLLGYWKYPLSVAIFIPGDEGKQNWQQLYIQKKISRMKFAAGSSVVAVYARSIQDDYPPNYLRNLALRKMSEDYVVFLDPGLLPSPRFVEEFRKTLLSLEDNGADTTKMAFVVPSFEMVKELPVPSVKEELKDLVTGNDPGAVSYKRLTDPDAHRSTDYRRWFRTTRPYDVEVYHEKYAPYIIVKKSGYLPKFDERFIDGPLDRQSYTMELMAAGYNLVVLPNVWAIAQASSSMRSAAGSDQPGLFRQTELYIERFEFISELIRNYKLGLCGDNEERSPDGDAN